jgi:hypothetical protein
MSKFLKYQLNHVGIKVLCSENCGISSEFMTTRLVIPLDAISNDISLEVRSCVVITVIVHCMWYRILQIILFLAGSLVSKKGELKFH